MPDSSHTWQFIPGAGPGWQAFPFAGGWLVRGGGGGVIFVPGPDQRGGTDAGTITILAAIADLKQELGTMSETTQQHVDALAAQLTTMDATLKAGITSITDEIAALKTANPTVDFTALDSAVAAMGTDVAAVAAIPPAPPPPAPPAPAAP